jgi:hypothetical protein
MQKSNYGDYYENSQCPRFGQPLLCPVILIPPYINYILAFVFFVHSSNNIFVMNLSQFVSFISVAKDKSFKNSKVLKSYLDSIISQIPSAEDESVWFQQIHDSIPAWVS